MKYEQRIIVLSCLSAIDGEVMAFISNGQANLGNVGTSGVDYIRDNTKVTGYHSIKVLSRIKLGHNFVLRLFF